MITNNINPLDGEK